MLCCPPCEALSLGRVQAAQHSVEESPAVDFDGPGGGEVVAPFQSFVQQGTDDLGAVQVEVGVVAGTHNRARVQPSVTDQTTRAPVEDDDQPARGARLPEGQDLSAVVVSCVAFLVLDEFMSVTRSPVVGERSGKEAARRTVPGHGRRT